MAQDAFDLIDKLARLHNIIITDWVTPDTFMSMFPELTDEQAIAACHNLSIGEYDTAIDCDVRYEVMREAIQND